MPQIVKLSSLSFLGLAVETAFGTAIAPTGFIPVTSFKPQDSPTFVSDNGMRGVAAMDFGEYLGPVEAEYEFDGLAFPTSVGNVIAPLFGAETLTGATAPYTHLWKLSADGSAPSYTLNDFYVAGNRQFPGARSDKATFKFNAKTGLTYTSHWLGYASQTATKPGSSTFSTDKALMGWTAQVTLGGSTSVNLLSATITISREGSEAVFTAQNSQNPYDILLGPMRVAWQLTLAMTSDTEYNYATSQGSKSVSVKFTDAATGDTLTFTSTSVQFTRPTIDRGERYVTVSLSGTALNNSTDGGPMSVTAVNEVATSYITQAAS